MLKCASKTGAICGVLNSMGKCHRTVQIDNNEYAFWLR